MACLRHGLVMTSLLVLTTSLVKSSSINNDLMDEFRYLLDGIYDNEEEHVCTKRYTDTAVQRLHFTIKEVSVPLFGSSTWFFVEQYTDNDPSQVYRRRIYQADVYDDDSIRMKFHRFNPLVEDKYRYSHYNPDILLDLTSDDLTYIPGCDVIWSLIGENHFRTSMLEDECYVFGGTVRLTDILNLTPKYLTLAYRMYDAEDGSLVLSADYNLTRQLPRSTLGGYTEVMDALLQGHQVNFQANLAQCRSDGERVIDINKHGGKVTNFKTFNNSIFGPRAFVSFSSQRKIISDDMMTWRYARVSVYEDDEVRIILSVWNQTTNSRIAEDIVYCPIETDAASSRGVTFYKSGEIGRSPLGHYGDVTSSLRMGRTLSYVARYGGCVLRDGSVSTSSTVMGGQITDYDIEENNGYLDFSVVDIVYNMQEGQPGDFNLNMRAHRAYPNGTIHRIVTNNEYYSHQVVLVSERYCGIFPQQLNGTFSFFTVGGESIINCLGYIRESPVFDSGQSTTSVSLQLIAIVVLAQQMF